MSTALFAARRWKHRCNQWHGFPIRARNETRVGNPRHDESMSAFPKTTAVLQQWIASGHQIGAQVYISRDAQPLADFAVGESRPGVAMTTDTLMLWLSASKPFAAVALAQLRERGSLDFDDPVIRFIPEF